MSFTEFISNTAREPAMLLVVALTPGAMLVNGRTDAPNAIAACVSTRCLRPKAAIAMAAVCNFAGVFVMSLLSAKVASAIMNMARFDVVAPSDAADIMESVIMKNT